MRTLPRVSIVVPMYNASKTICKCLESITKLDYPNFELIVVDDGSHDDSADLARRFPCSVVMLDKNSGPGVARNEGARRATGEVVAFTDADCEVPDDWIRKMIEDLERYDIAAVSGGYSASANSGFIPLFQFYDTSFRQRKVPGYIDGCITANFACKKSAFDEAGGFPPIRVNEDMEFGEKLSKRYKILWNSGNGVCHHFEKSSSKYFTEQMRWSESVARLYLSSPTSFFKDNTWQNGEVLGHLLFTAFLYASLVGMAFYPPLSGIFLFLLVLYYGANILFVSFVAKREGIITGLEAFLFLFVRNTAWLLGILKAIFPRPRGRDMV